MFCHNSGTLSFKSLCQLWWESDDRGNGDNIGDNDIGGGSSGDGVDGGDRDNEGGNNDDKDDDNDGDYDRSNGDGGILTVVW